MTPGSRVRKKAGRPCPECGAYLQWHPSGTLTLEGAKTSRAILHGLSGTCPVQALWNSAGRGWGTRLVNFVRRWTPHAWHRRLVRLQEERAQSRAERAVGVYSLSLGPEFPPCPDSSCHPITVYGGKLDVRWEAAFIPASHGLRVMKHQIKPWVQATGGYWAIPIPEWWEDSTISAGWTNLVVWYHNGRMFKLESEWMTREELTP